MMIAALRLAAAIAATGLWLQPAAANGFTTSTGHSIQLPDVRSLDCGGMQAAMDRIDATGYRTGPAPRNPSDGPLYDYEKRLAEERYQRCLRGGGIR
ncbi:hypothetical protein [Neomegalonema sp.]|uniref:hypothetical protein n=1 Tax=Neomegalonema sp. TaxID=2039713 RepID=UPI0026182D8C|nr:hypothetical protein [Neomegalonema sp.]MDD2869359.1 hypothetical protein [Neomegalonema sp.]